MRCAYRYLTTKKEQNVRVTVVGIKRPGRETAGNRLIHSHRKKNFGAPATRSTPLGSRLTSTTVSERLSPVKTFSFRPNDGRTKRHDRKRTKNSQHNYVYIPVCFSTRYYVFIKLCVLPEYKTSLFRPRVFSRALGCGARRRPACTPRCKCGSRSGSVARALGVRSREIWRVPRGSLSAQPEPHKTTGIPFSG